VDQINLGVQWDVSPDLQAALKTQQELAAKNPQSKDGKKLTPAQKRDAAFAQVAQAIETGDVEKVDDLLLENPKLVFNIGDYSAVYKALMENFDASVAKKLVERSLHMNTYSVYQHLLRKHQPSLLEYFVEMCTAEKSSHWLKTIYIQALKGFTSNISDQRRKEWREQRSMLEKLDPNAFLKSVAHENFFNIFTTYTSLPEQERKQLETLSEQDWKKSFAAWFESFEETQYRQNPQIGLKSFSNLLNFLRDFPNARIGWDGAVQGLKSQNQAYKDFIVQYFKPDEEFEASELARILKEFHTGFRSISFPFKHNEGASKLGLNSFEMQELGASDWGSGTFAANAGVAPPFKQMVRYMAPSFVHILVKTASPASLALLESQSGKDLYWECLQEPAVFKSWCTKASQDMINTVVRACPQMLQWNDKHNNSLAHHLVFLRMESSQVFGQLMARLNHNWLLQENDVGVSVKDLFKSFGATENMLNMLDKETIKRSMKDAGIKKTRRTDPAPKRRM